MKKHLASKFPEFPAWIQKSLIPAIIFALSFALYVRTLTPTIGFGDNGDFVTASYRLGVPHPTGYPLFTLLGKLFTFIPLRNVAFRVNVVSVLFAALTIVVVYLVVEKITSDRISAIFASLILAVSNLFWSQAILADVHSLHVFFLSLLILMLLNLGATEGEDGFGENKITTSKLYLFAFVLGISLTNHMSMILYIPAFLFLILDTEWKIIKNLRVLPLAALCFLLGLVPYLYVPLRASQQLARAWPPPSNMQNFIAYVTARAYRGYFSYFSPEVAGLQAPMYFSLLIKQFSFYLLLLIPLGIWYSLKKDKKLFLFLFLFYLMNLAFFINYHVGDVELFFLPSYLVCAIFIGLGAAQLKELAMRVNVKRNIQNGLIATIFLALAIALAATFLTNFPKLDKSRLWTAREGAEYMLKTTKKGSIILFVGDYAFALDYLREVEGIRPDVAVIDAYQVGNLIYTAQAKKKYPTIEFPTDLKESNVGTLESFIKKNIDHHPIYSGRLLEPTLLEKFGNIYRGLFFEISTKRKGAIVEDNKIINPFSKTDFKHLQLERDAWVTTSLPYINLTDVYLYQHRLDKALDVCNQGLSVYPRSAFLRRHRGNIYARQNKTQKAMREYEKAISLYPGFSGPYYNLGLIYFEKKRYEKAYDLFQKAIFYSIPIRNMDVDIFYHQALLADGFGDRDKAIQYWEIFLHLQPTSTERIEQAKERLKILRKEVK